MADQILQRHGTQTFATWYFVTSSFAAATAASAIAGRGPKMQRTRA
jgi:hypothetical protein